MSALPLTGDLVAEYRELFADMVLRPEWKGQLVLATRRIAEGQSQYEAVSEALGGRIPWEWIGAIHQLESGGDFTTHLHNGDPLTARTVHDPKGRPVNGKPPFTWAQSATDALTQRGLQKVQVWTVTVMLYQGEAYNGFGYREFHSSVKSPYLWSGSTFYTKGKYASDGKFDPNEVSQEIGVAPILRSFFSVAKGVQS